MTLGAFPQEKKSLFFSDLEGSPLKVYGNLC